MVPSSEFAAQIFSLLDAHMLFGVWHVTADSPIHTDQSPLPRTNPDMAQVALDSVCELASGKLADKKDSDSGTNGKIVSSSEDRRIAALAAELVVRRAEFVLVEWVRGEGQLSYDTPVGKARHAQVRVCMCVCVCVCVCVLVEWVRGEEQSSYDAY
jgi:hypothetical protein